MQLSLRHRFPHALVVTLAGLVLGAQSASAQDKVVPEELRSAATATVTKPDGWTAKASLGANFAFNHSSNVVGADDGASIQFGLVLGAELKVISNEHEWDNALAIQHAQTRTPQIPRFAKSLDNLDLKSTYLYHLRSAPWFGPYGRFRLLTQIFSGFALRSEDTTVARTDADGTVTTEAIPAFERIELTSAFEPLTLREGLGAFANVLERKDITIKTKLGAAAQQIITQDGYVLADDGDTAQLEVTQLETSNDLGAELDIELSGQAIDDVATWRTFANFFYPFASSADTDLEGLEVVNIELGAAISLKLAKWLSLDYVLNAKKSPLVTEDFQVQNGIILTAGFNLLGD